MRDVCYISPRTKSDSQYVIALFRMCTTDSIDNLHTIVTRQQGNKLLKIGPRSGLDIAYFSHRMRFYIQLVGIQVMRV